MKRKKILLYTMIMIKGGTERTIANLSNHFIDKYDITIVCNINHPVEYDLDSRIKLICIDKDDKYGEKIPKKIFTKLGPKRNKILKEIISKEKPELIISFLPEPSIRSLILKKDFPSIPVLVAIRNIPTKEFITLPEKKLRNHYYKKADCIILQDETFIKFLPEHLINKITVIPNYITNSILNTKLDNKKEKKIVTITRLEKQKNVKLLINAFSKLDRRFDNYKLYIYGNGSLKKKLEELINNLNLNKKVFLKGTSNNINDEIKNASLFVLPSNYEGIPNSLLEAMSLALPVIATNSSTTIPKIINNNSNGIIINKNSEQELIDKIEYLLDNKELRESLGKNAYNVRYIYNQDMILKEWDQIIKTNIN